MRLSITKIIRFYNRNRQRLIRELIIYLLAKLYAYIYVRKLITLFISTRLPKKWVFLVGCYNSGTTITKEVLGMHPDISILPREGVRFTSELPTPEDKGWPRMWIQCPDYMEMPLDSDPAKAEKIIKDWSIWWDNHASTFLEKSISNTTRMRWLDRHFKNAYFIGIVRNGYCASEGIKRKAKPKNTKKNIMREYNYAMCGRQWKDANEKLLNSAQEVQRYIQISYEDLMHSPVQVLEQVFDFLELPKLEMSFIESSSILSIYGGHIKLSNMNTESLSRLSSEDRGILNTEIASMQKVLGYDVID